MTEFATLAIHNQQPLDAIRQLLKRLLDIGVVKAVLVPAAKPGESSARPAVIADSAQMVLANPLIPVMPINSARMAALITQRATTGPNGGPGEAERIAVVMRPCELRAAVELTKLYQINNSQLLTIGIDCIGTYELRTLTAAQAGPEKILKVSIEDARRADPDTTGGIPYRHACTICLTPVAWKADIALHLIGVENEAEILVEAADRSLLEALELAPGTDPSKHQAAVKAFIGIRQARRTSELDKLATQMNFREGEYPAFVEVFRQCQRCLNCTVACPLCYCKECLFRTDTFAHEPGRYLGWARRKGATSLPGDTIAFQLTRLLHVSMSCVGCGLCTSACPADLPIDSIFQLVAERTQALLAYVPGRDQQEPLPIATFREDEFSTLGETEH